MKKFKKFLLIIWILNLLLLLIYFILSRFTPNDYINSGEFLWSRIILYIFLLIDYIRMNFDTCKVDSQILYVVLLLIALFVGTIGLSFIIQLNYHRISEFAFFMFFSIFLRIYSHTIEIPNFLLLKNK